jgi:hypothetical protein
MQSDDTMYYELTNLRKTGKFVLLFKKKFKTGFFFSSFKDRSWIALYSG